MIGVRMLYDIEVIEVLLDMLRRFNLGSAQVHRLSEYITALRGMTKEKNITFGVSKRKRNEP